MELHKVPVEVCVDIGVDGPVNLFALLEQTAQRFPDRGAVYHGERRCCTWRELRDRALRLAGSIRLQQWPAGARIAIVSENRPEIVELLFGIWAAECVAVPINYKLHPREMVQILEDASVSQVFASATIAAELGSSCGCPVESRCGQTHTHIGWPLRPRRCRAPIRRRWPGCSTPAGRRAGRKAPCSPIAT